MERHIRQKYESKVLSSDSQPASTQHTGSTGSFEERRSAELPPKPSKRFTFGLRSTSSAFPLRTDARSPPLSPRISGMGSAMSRKASPPLRRNKPSKIFGADIGGSRQDNYELKLIALREMGFPDDKRNLAILKGEGGNVDRAQAVLMRLGEGNHPSSGRSSPAPETPPKDEPTSASSSSKVNPFDRLDLQDKALPPPPVEETPPRPQVGLNISASNGYNPFMHNQTPTSNLAQNFQNLTVSQPSQLFPNTTGGYVQQPVTTNPFLQTYTPPPTQAVYGPPQPFSQSHPFQQPQAQPQPVAQQTMGIPNPFMQANTQSQFPTSNPFGMQSSAYSTYPNGHTPQYSSNVSNGQNNAIFAPAQHAPQFSQINATPSPFSHVPRQASPNPFLQTQFQTPQPMAQSFTNTGMVSSPIQTPGAYQNNPFDMQFQNQFHSQSVPVPSPMPAKLDKSSILALYNMPATSSPLAQTQTNPMASDTATLQPPMQPPMQPPAAKRSVTMPLPSANATAGANNPFASMAAPTPAAQALPKLAAGGHTKAQFAHMSHESVDFSTMANGRHSPDAFAGLSARIMR